MPSVVALPDQCPCRWQGVRTATRKIVFNESGKPWLLHDLERDPGERRNLAGEGEHTAEFAAAQALLKATD
mgnify:CR=1 FL=1